jgi:prepilin-type processing-associated H-X9-DG protein
MDKMHHPCMANGKNANAPVVLPKVGTTFPFVVQWISHETTKRKKHKKIKHNTHLFSHKVHIECWVNYLFILNGVQDCCFDANNYQLLFVDGHVCKCLSPTFSVFLIPSKG